MQVGRWPTQYQKGHIGKWLQCQSKLLKNVSNIGQSAKKILILSQSVKKILTLHHIPEIYFNLKPICSKKIQTLSQYAYAKLVLS
jgi:hypothetical protein